MHRTKEHEFLNIKIQLQRYFCPVDVFFWLQCKGLTLAPELEVAGAQLDAAGAASHSVVAAFKESPDPFGDPDEYLLQRVDAGNVCADEFAGGVLWNA